eukprot:274357_1
MSINICATCQKPASSLCSGCKKVYYCNQQCQRKDWGHHKKICKTLNNKSTTKTTKTKQRKDRKQHKQQCNLQKKELIDDKKNITKEQNNCKSWISCSCTQRIINALKYYESLDIIHNESDKDSLFEFCHEKYPSLLNDYIHIIQTHNDEFQDIHDYICQNEQLKPC